MPSPFSSPRRGFTLVHRGFTLVHRGLAVVRRGFTRVDRGFTRVDRGFTRVDRGFTLIEMMVTLTLLGILIALVTPSFQGLLRDNRAATQANALLGALALARSEAIKRNVPVVVCRSNTGTSCAGAEWEAGWIVWPDADRDGALDADDGDGVPEAGEEMLIATQGALVGKFDLTAAASSITYRPDGSTTATDAFELTPPGGDTEHGRCIEIDATGRPKVAKGACP